MEQGVKPDFNHRSDNKKKEGRGRTMQTNGNIMKTNGFKYATNAYSVDHKKEEGVRIMFRILGTMTMGRKTFPCMRAVSEKVFATFQGKRSITIDTYKVGVAPLRSLANTLRNFYRCTVTVTGPAERFTFFEFYPEDGKVYGAIMELLGETYTKVRKGYMIQRCFWTAKEASAFKAKLKGLKVKIKESKYWSITLYPLAN